MEYSKEDLMEAKKQIWGVGENMGTEESKKNWEENAQFWDNAMGDESNEFHREVVRPKVTELLSPNPADYILDIACGNGNYSSYLAQRGASVVAFDYSKKMIELAKRRQSQYAKQIEFCVADATDRKSILELNEITYCYVDSPNSAVHNVSFNDAFSAIKVDYDIFNYELQKGFPNPGFSILIDRIYASFKHAHTDDEQRMCLDYLGKITIKKCLRKGTSLRTYLKYLLLKIKYLFLSFKS